MLLLSGQGVCVLPDTFSTLSHCHLITYLLMFLLLIKCNVQTIDSLFLHTFYEGLSANWLIKKQNAVLFPLQVLLHFNGNEYFKVGKHILLNLFVAVQCVQNYFC